MIHSHHTISKLQMCFSTALSDTMKAKDNHTDSVDFVQVEGILWKQEQCEKNCFTVFKKYGNNLHSNQCAVQNICGLHGEIKNIICSSQNKFRISESHKYWR